MGKKKGQVAKIALEYLNESGSENLSISTLSESYGLPLKLLHSLYPKGDDELRLDVLEYAGDVWLESLREEIQKESSPESRLDTLVKGFALGSCSHPQALNAYVDQWKKAKDGNDYVQNRLAVIYDGYVQAFVSIVRNYIGTGVGKASLTAVGQILTTQSDMLHLQWWILRNPVNFDEVGKALCKAVRLMLLEGQI